MSSSIDHLIVPLQTSHVFVPPKPLIAFLFGTSLPGISDRTWVMHADHRLSMPTACESESKGAISRALALLAGIAIIAG